MNKIAIIAVAYNRVDSLKRLLSTLQQAYYNDERPTLIISIDKSNTDIVERFADDYVWPHGNKIVRKHERNLGLREHMMSLGEWFKDYEVLVVLEDDIIVSQNFYLFTRKVSDKYYDNPQIAGLSLYSFALNYQSYLPFTPIKNEYDIYLMNCAMSWGEVWMKPQWMEFYSWYKNHLDFPVQPHLPERICGWKKSWLKYHTRYCIEENKYFVYPYASLSSNFGDAGTHNVEVRVNNYQVALQCGIKSDYLLPSNTDQAVLYDGFFENKSLYQTLNLSERELCIDLYGNKKNREHKRFWLTTGIFNYHINKSYGLSYRPLEMNVIKDYPGTTIFLYDTSIVETNPVMKNNNVLLYYTYQRDCFHFIDRYGRSMILREWFKGKLNAFKRYVFG